MSAAVEICRHTRPQIASQTFSYFDLHFEGRKIDDSEQGRILRDAGAIGHLHLANLSIHRRLYVQAIDLALQVRHQKLLPIEQCLLAVDIEVILLGLRLVIAFRLLEGELCFLQRVLRLERL